MKKYTFIIVAVISLVACSDDGNYHLERVTGKWRYSFSRDSGGNEDHSDGGERAILEITSDSKFRYYNSQGVPTPQVKVSVGRREILFYSVNEFTGEKWETTHPYYFKQDTLVMHADGGFEFIDHHYVRME